MNLEQQRTKIDKIDTAILELLRRRASLSRTIGSIKAATGLPIIDRAREEIVVRRLVRESEGDVSPESIMNIYNAILAESQRIQLEIAAEVATPQEVRA